MTNDYDTETILNRFLPMPVDPNSDRIQAFKRASDRFELRRDIREGRISVGEAIERFAAEIASRN